MRFASLLTILLYLSQAGLAVAPVPAPPSPGASVACCVICAEGGPCCCLGDGTRCDLTWAVGTILRPMPCSTPRPMVLPAGVSTPDHLRPGPLSLADPVSLQIRRPLVAARLHSIRVGFPDKIPIL